MSNILRYTQFIAEQVRKNSITGRHANIQEGRFNNSPTPTEGFPAGQKPHPSIVKSAHKNDAEAIEHVHSKDGHSVQAEHYDTASTYHHIDDKGKIAGSIDMDHDDGVPSLKNIKKELPNAPDHVHKAIRRSAKENIGFD